MVSLQDQVQTLSRPASSASSMSGRGDSDIEGDVSESEESSEEIGDGYDSDTTLKDEAEGEENEEGGNKDEDEKKDEEEGEC